jgi:hypothetical protein
MMKTFFLGVLLFGLLQTATPPAPRTQQDEIKARAEESGKAMLTGDFGKLADLTYPKVVELMGGRAKMVAFLVKETSKMQSEGFEFLSVDIGQPGAVVKGGDKLFSLVPMTLKMKVPGGTLTGNSYLLGISDGRVWTFISGSDMDETKLKIIVPEAAGLITLPASKPPVFEKTP